jgi:hypothetical protein
MTDNDRIAQIGALIDEKGYASAILATLGDNIPYLIAACGTLASERYTDSENDRVMYAFPDESCIIVYGGDHAEIG